MYDIPLRPAVTMAKVPTSLLAALLSVVLACNGEPISPTAQVFSMRISGDRQIGDAGIALEPLSVRVFDEQNRPVRGVPIVWQLIAGSGMIEPALNTTGSDGSASAVLEPGPGENIVRVRIRDGTTEATLSATGCAPICPVWSFDKPLPVARRWSTATTDGSTIWLLGGRVTNTEFLVTQEVVTYDPLSGVSTPGPALPVPRGGGLATSVGEELLYIGGHADDGWLSYGQKEVFSLHPGSGTWVAGAPLATGRFHAAGAAIGGKIYVAGGLTACDDFDNLCERALSSLEIYDVEADEWTSGAAMQTGRAGAGATSFDGRLYVAGGQDCGSWWTACAGLSSVEMYDPVTDTWVTKAPMPFEGRTHLVVTGRRITAFISSLERSVVCEYDPIADTWQPVANAPRRIGPAVIAFDDALYVIGGENGGYGGKYELYDTVMLLQR